MLVQLDAVQVTFKGQVIEYRRYPKSRREDVHAHSSGPVRFPSNPEVCTVYL